MLPSYLAHPALPPLTIGARPEPNRDVRDRLAAGFCQHHGFQPRVVVAGKREGDERRLDLSSCTRLLGLDEKGSAERREGNHSNGTAAPYARPIDRFYFRFKRRFECASASISVRLTPDLLADNPISALIPFSYLGFVARVDPTSPDPEVLGHLLPVPVGGSGLVIADLKDLLEVDVAALRPGSFPDSNFTDVSPAVLLFSRDAEHTNFVPFVAPGAAMPEEDFGCYVHLTDYREGISLGQTRQRISIRGIKSLLGWSAVNARFNDEGVDQGDDEQSRSVEPPSEERSPLLPCEYGGHQPKHEYRQEQGHELLQADVTHSIVLETSRFRNDLACRGSCGRGPLQDSA